MRTSNAGRASISSPITMRIPRRYFSEATRSTEAERRPCGILPGSPQTRSGAPSVGVAEGHGEPAEQSLVRLEELRGIGQFFEVVLEIRELPEPMLGLFG